jgi:hypothetical protein
MGLNGVGKLTRHIGDDAIAPTGGQILFIKQVDRYFVPNRWTDTLYLTGGQILGI